jgi:hypothetical protein
MIKEEEKRGIDSEGGYVEEKRQGGEILSKGYR